jgi:hypothetical protein
MMNITHQVPDAALWPLKPGQARRLSATHDKRVLWVHDGRVWATRTGERTGEHDRDEDQWLAGGQAIELPAGSEWVIEPWPAAQVGVLVVPG